MTISHLLILTTIPAVVSPVVAQDAEAPIHWTDVRSLTVEGRGYPDTKAPFDRLPARAEGVVREPVWNLSRHSAGIAARFVTDAPEIHARWTLTSSRIAMPHMPATGVSGLDLYARDSSGAWRWVAVAMPSERTSQEARITAGLPEGPREYLLYLPLYNGVSSVEVGVPEGARLTAAEPRDVAHQRPIVFYGTSITQGGCASRPGMVHTAILGRRFDRPVINLGFSGNGTLDPELAPMLAEIDAAVYVLDCLPNLVADQVAERTEPFVKALRAARPETPIVLAEDRTYTNAWIQTGSRARNRTSRDALRAAFERLKAEGVPNLAYLKGDNQLGDDDEGTVDGSHPTDLGFARMADVFAQVLAPLLDAENSQAARSTERLPRDNLLVFRDDDGSIRDVRTPDEWAKRRAEIRAGVEAVMGKLPGDAKRCPLEMRIEDETDCGTYVRRLITYASEPGGRVPAYLLIPKAVLENEGRRAPAVLCLHPTNDQIGHGVVVGLGGRENRRYAAELAERGFVTLAPSYPLLANYQPDLAALGWESGTLKAVWDNIRGLDLLDALPFVQPGRYATIGHSLGGHNSVYTAFFDDRLQVVVTSCGLDSFLDYYDGNEAVWLPEKGWTQTRYMPRLREYRGRLEAIPFDFHELIGALAPRRVLIVAPTGDDNFRAASVDRVVAAARPVYELLGNPERLQVEHPECAHDFPDDMRMRAYELIDQVLRGDDEGASP